MSLKVHSLVENADDDDASLLIAEEDIVRTAWVKKIDSAIEFYLASVTNPCRQFRNHIDGGVMIMISLLR